MDCFQRKGVLPLNMGLVVFKDGASVLKSCVNVFQSWDELSSEVG